VLEAILQRSIFTPLQRGVRRSLGVQVLLCDTVNTFYVLYFVYISDGELRTGNHPPATHTSIPLGLFRHCEYFFSSLLCFVTKTDHTACVQTCRSA